MRAPQYGDVRLKPWTNIQTDTHGNFKVKLITPAVTMHVRAVILPGQALSGRSSQATIYVTPRAFLNVDAGLTDLEYSYNSLADGRLELPGRRWRRVRSGDAARVFIYSVASGSRYGYLETSARLPRATCNDAACERRASGHLRLTPRIEHARSLVGCTRGQPFVGVGVRLPRAFCGAHRIRVR